MGGRAPKVGVFIRIQQAVLHWPKALVCPRLWDPAHHLDCRILPSYPKMLLNHVQGLTEEENDRQSQVMAERGLY